MAELVPVEFNPFKASATPSDFAARYGSAAQKAGNALGVDPQVLLGQWGLETGWGKSVIPGTNNLGNIKDVSGGGTSAKDNMTGSVDKYRTYDSPDQFADDYVSLVQRKYPGAVGAKDPLAFAQALKAGGYAEDPRYVDKVVQATRMAGNRQNPIIAAVGRAVESVIPSAQASEKAPELVPVDFDPFAKKEQPSAASRVISGAVQGAKDLTGGLVRGAGSIGATLLAPGDVIQDAMAGRPLMSSNNQRRADIDAALQNLIGADPNSLVYGAGKLTGEIAGTAGVGPALGAGARVAGAGPEIVNALRTGGMSLGQNASGGAVQNLLTRAVGGAATGGASAGLVNPEDAGTGAVVGGVLPAAIKSTGLVGNALGRAASGGPLAPEVQALAQRAKTLGIDIPADRLVNSKPLNALASSLDYVPGSGRTATMGKMEDQLNRAVSRTFGQDSANVTQALRKAGDDLGAKFDKTLSSNTVKVDSQFLNDLTDATQMASKELGSDGAKIIQNQVDEILAKAQSAKMPALKKLDIPTGTSLSKAEELLPPVPDGFTRLYRGESPTVKFHDVFEASGLTGKRAEHLKGERFTPDIKYADYYRQSYGHDAKLTYVDVPTKIAEKGRVDASEVKLSADLFSGPFSTGGEAAIDGQAAYNIKKTLDRISNRNTPEAFYARDLKQKLMEALNRSLGPDEAKAFSEVRKQYGNMLSMEKLAQNGAEGGISIAKLANMRNINNPELQELSDISAQFLKSREGAHGAAQRVGAGALTLGLAGPAGLAAGVGTGRAANMLLNSNAVKNRILAAPTNRLIGEPNPLELLTARSAPLLAGNR